MIFLFIGTVGISILLSVLSSSLLWKYFDKPIYGFIPALSMTMISVLMISIFEIWNPVHLSDEAVIAILYCLCVAFFSFQFLVILLIIKRASINDTMKEGTF